MKYLTIWVSLVTRVAADSFFWWGWGKRGEQDWETNVEIMYPLIELRNVSQQARAHCPPRIPVLRDSGALAACTAAPQFLTQHSVSAAGALPEPYANETSSQALTAEAEEGGRREFKGHRAGGKLAQLPEKKCILGFSAAVFCSS